MKPRIRHAIDTLPTFAITGVTVLLLAGCGAAAGGITSPTVGAATPIATATPTATPAPTPNLTTTAAAAYLAAATAGNAAGDAINKAYPKTFTSLAQAKHYWSQYEAVDRAFLSTIFAIAYPPFMKADVDAQIAVETKVVEDDSELAVSPNDNAAYAADNTDSTAASAAANIVRHDLGLPQVPLTP